MRLFFESKRTANSSITVEHHSLPPNEILVADSDSDNDAPVRAAKRRRIEDFGYRYLHSRAPVLLSTSLKRPLGSDWTNPWAKSRDESRRERQIRTSKLHEELRRQNVEDKAKSKTRKVERTQRKQKAYELQKDNLGRSSKRPVDLIASLSKATPTRTQRHRERELPRAGAKDQMSIHAIGLDARVCLERLLNYQWETSKITPRRRSPQGLFQRVNFGRL